MMWLKEWRGGRGHFVPATEPIRSERARVFAAVSGGLRLALKPAVPIRQGLGPQSRPKNRLRSSMASARKRPGASVLRLLRLLRIDTHVGLAGESGEVNLQQ